MSKQKAITASSFLGEIFQFGFYKASQGRITRQVTLATLWGTFAIGCWRLFLALYQWTPMWQWIVPLGILALGVWISFRVVNYPRFADFLIAVEAEMNKVSWPSRTELIRSSIVVIFVIFSLAIILFSYDLLWRFLFKEVLVILK